MRPSAAFLQTRVARRVFGLFLLCAVLPAATLATATFWLVRLELRAQASAQLAMASKVAGTLLLERLVSADEELLRLAASMTTRESSRPSAPARQLVPRFSAVVARVSGGEVRPLWGAMKGGLPPFSADQAAAHLASGKALLVVTKGRTPATVFLVRAIGDGPEPNATLWAMLARDYLWQDGTDNPLAPPGTDLCVFAQETLLPLYCSRNGTAASALPISAPGRNSTDSSSSGEEVTGTSSVFLGFEFANEPWTVVLQQPFVAFTARRGFRRSVVLTLLLGLSLVVLASNVLLRHRLDPIARLKDGTRRLADGDFSSPVDVRTGDEFEELASSFNLMAGRLRDQFAFIGMLHDVDRLALLGRSEDEIVVAALEHLPTLLPARAVTVAVGRPGAGDGRLAIWRRGGDGRPTFESLSHGHDLLEELAAAAVWRVEPGFPAPRLMDFLLADGGATRLAFPLTDRGACFGAVVLGAAAGTGVVKENLDRGRQIADQLALALANTLLFERLNALSLGTLQALARAIDANSPWTAGHSERVTRVSVAIGRQLALPTDQLERLHRGGLLHDVGKVGVPGAVLDKPGKLDLEELLLIRTHPVLGARILEPVQAYADVIPIVRHHHERFDGKGYPDGLVGHAIPLLARVVAVADVYDALVSDRPYREGWAPAAAVAYIAERGGAEFDPEIVTAFLALLDTPSWTEMALVNEHTVSRTFRALAT